jgi:hypothetical protein
MQQVVEITKIRTDHLRALEAGNYDVFSAPVYIRGFVRGYAKLLKLDVPQSHGGAGSRAGGQTTKFAEPPPLAERPGTFARFPHCCTSRRWIGERALIGLGRDDRSWWLVDLGLGRLAASQPPEGLESRRCIAPRQDTSGDTLPLPAPTPKR